MATPLCAKAGIAAPAFEGDIFRRVFERVVEACIAAGLVGGVHQRLGGEEGQASSGACSETKGLRLGTME